MVEIDGRVIELCNQYLGFQGNYSDPRVTLHVGDAAAFVARPEVQKEPFDVVIIDATDPEGGPGDVLYGEEFLRHVKACLKDDGACLRHLGIPSLQGPVLAEGVAKLKQVFGHVQVARISIPAYVGGEMAFVVSSMNGSPLNKAHSDFTGDFYSPAMHEASFVLPPYWLRELKLD
jgi:spermidine synthase